MNMLRFWCRFTRIHHQIFYKLGIVEFISGFGSAASWAVSVYPAYQQTRKLFNCILGETYEMVNHNGAPSLLSRSVAE
jgi:hypothetical protein